MRILLDTHIILWVLENNEKADPYPIRKTESVLNQGQKRRPLIQPTSGSFFRNYDSLSG